MYQSDCTLLNREAGDRIEAVPDPRSIQYPVTIRLLSGTYAGSASVCLDWEMADQLCSQLETLLRPRRLDQEADARLGRDSTGASASDLDESYQRALAGGA